jgi:predicted lipid-binding transport protein (Tim44 family)
MQKRSIIIALFVVFFGASLFVETTAWAKAGGGRSFGSRGSKSLSTPRSPSSNPSYGSPAGQTPGTRSNQPAAGGWSRSPFTQGLLGGLAGGFIGNMLFGGMGHAASGTETGGGFGLLELALLGAAIYFGMKFLRRRMQRSPAAANYQSTDAPYAERFQSMQSAPRVESTYGGAQPMQIPGSAEGSAGLAQIRQYDPSFSEEAFKELVEDLFFRIQAGWMNRSVEGIEPLLTAEMTTFFNEEFNSMKERGRINRLENIAVRKVEITETWQEMGQDFVTVLFTASLLDYVVDDQSGQVMEGDRMSPIKFQEFWTFCRNVGSGSAWRLSAIQQPT